MTKPPINLALLINKIIFVIIYKSLIINILYYFILIIGLVIREISTLK